MKTKIKISVIGCDDTTTVEMELTEEELSFLDRFAELVCETSTYVCMPTIDYQKVLSEEEVLEKERIAKIELEEKIRF